MNPPYTEQQAVLNLQRYLRLLSDYEPSILPVPLDGIFDTATEDALRAFQRSVGLNPSGRADKETWDALYQAYLRLVEATDRTPTVHLFPRTPAQYEAAIGEESAFVAVLQLLLGELRIVYDDIPPLSPTGIFDSATEHAVKVVQAASGLPVTGRVDLRMWNRLVRDFERYAR